MSEGKKLRILKNILGNFQHSSDEYLFYCPSCNHHKKKLSVNLDKNVFKCWICDFSGNSIRRLIRKFGDYVALSKWSELTDEVDLGSFSSNLFEEEKEVEINRLNLPSEFITMSCNFSKLTCISLIINLIFLFKLIPIYFTLFVYLNFTYTINIR